MNKIMDSLDVKDRRILYELDFNSRQSNSKIGKKVGLHKNVVNYRIKRMEKNGIISLRYFFLTIEKKEPYRVKNQNLFQAHTTRYSIAFYRHLNVYLVPENLNK